MDVMYRRVKQLGCIKEKGQGQKVLEDAQGNLLIEDEDIKARWKQYIEDLYCKKGRPDRVPVEDEEQVGDDDLGPELLECEVISAIDRLRGKKAEGEDGIPAEFIKALDSEARVKFVELCMDIYKDGVWPEDYCKSVLVPLEKKTNATRCEDHRTISLISHASKVLLRVLTTRLERKANDWIGKDQFGFRNGCGTREAIGVMRVLSERSMEFQQELYVCFVDFEKAFDRVNWTKLMMVLRQIGIDWRDRRLIAQLYLRQTASVRTRTGTTDPAIIGRGVRQGCLVSPILFNIYAEAMLREALEEVEGVRVGGQLVKSVRFADDQAMVASTASGLQHMMECTNKIVNNYGMRINIKKTKVMKIGKQQSQIHVVIEGKVLEQVHNFKYLGSLIAEDGYCEKEIRARIAMAKAAFERHNTLFTGCIRLQLRKRMIKCFVWSVLLYGSETWTMRKADRKRIDAFEMWIWRRMENIKWMDKVRNEEVLIRVDEAHLKLTDNIKLRKKRWLGHILRHESLLKEVMEGRMEGKRPRGRKRLMMMDDIRSGRTYYQTKRDAEDRDYWRGQL